MLVEARGHERLRPALDYAELSELVRVALRLERAYGHPLDLEFGVDEGRLWILQVRPVPAWLALLRDADRSWPEAPKEEGPR